MFSRDANVLMLFQAGELSSPTVSFWGTHGKELRLSHCTCAYMLPPFGKMFLSTQLFP
jgi:hypothetical protein